MALRHVNVYSVWLRWVTSRLSTFAFLYVALRGGTSHYATLEGVTSQCVPFHHVGSFGALRFSLLVGCVTPIPLRQRYAPSRCFSFRCVASSRSSDSRRFTSRRSQVFTPYLQARWLMRCGAHTEAKTHFHEWLSLREQVDWRQTERKEPVIVLGSEVICAAVTGAIYWYLCWPVVPEWIT